MSRNRLLGFFGPFPLPFWIKGSSTLIQFLTSNYGTKPSLLCQGFVLVKYIPCTGLPSFAVSWDAADDGFYIGVDKSVTSTIP